MGIRFCCHHCGFELHVKDYQGGKRGKCPECQGRFRVPLQSADISQEIEDSVSKENQPAQSQPTSELAAKATAAPTPNAVQQQSAKPPANARELGATDRREPAAARSPESSVGSIPTSSEPPLETGSGRAGESDRPLSGIDAADATGRQGNRPPSPWPALAEATNSNWFVRPPSGGQFGPAQPDVMHQWLDEGRVTLDSLVWREGWEEWAPAAQVFPNLGGPDALLEQPIGSSLGPSGEPPASEPSLSERNRNQRKQRRRRNYMVMLAVLSVLAVGLLIALVLVIINQRAARKDQENAAEVQAMWPFEQKVARQLETAAETRVG